MRITEVPSDMRCLIHDLNETIKQMKDRRVVVADQGAGVIGLTRLGNLSIKVGAIGHLEAVLDLQRVTGARDALLVAAGVMNPRALLEPRRWKGSI